MANYQVKQCVEHLTIVLPTLTRKTIIIATDENESQQFDCKISTVLQTPKMSASRCYLSRFPKPCLFTLPNPRVFAIAPLFIYPYRCIPYHPCQISLHHHYTQVNVKLGTWMTSHRFGMYNLFTEFKNKQTAESNKRFLILTSGSLN